MFAGFEHYDSSGWCEFVVCDGRPKFSWNWHRRKSYVRLGEHSERVWLTHVAELGLGPDGANMAMIQSLRACTFTEDGFWQRELPMAQALEVHMVAMALRDFGVF
jgi:hypothetical protein